MKKTIFFLILIIPLLVVSQQVVPTSTENYVHKIVYKNGYTTPNISQATNDEKIETVQYLDGLGRPIQSVGVRQGGNDKDIITHIDYDDYGRQVKDYLPVSSSVNNGNFTIMGETDINDYYDLKYDDEWTAVQTPNPYSEKQFESSPLNRVLKQAAPGEDWKLGNGHEIEFDYQSNIAGEVKIYTVTLTSDYTPTLVGGTTAYAANELNKTITKDENHDGSTTKNHTTEEFKNKQGRVVLKRTYADFDINSDGDTIDAGETAVQHDTYYVYDDYGNLTFVLPPKAEATTGIPSSTVLNELCYQYKYDSRNRLIEKKIPGKGDTDDWEEIVYNKLDQPAMTRDSNLKAQGKWLFTKYDAFGRVVYTGFKSSIDSRDYFQNLVDTHTTATQYESKVSSGTGYLSTYYSSTAIPQSVTEILTINYYDNYYFNNDGLTVPVNGQYDAIISGTNTKGLATGSKVKVLGSTSWITTVMGYDQDRRPIWIGTKNNYLSTTEYIESKLKDNTDDISGLLRESKTTHQKTGKTDIVTIEKFTYNHSGKLLTQTHNINNLGEETIATNEYDDLGQLKREKVGNDQSTGSELQVIDYRYNIRGWLKEINEVDNLGSTDLFAFKINYNNPTSGTALFNGNISQSHWNSANINNTSNPESNQYIYNYDQLNRITSGIDNTGNYNLDLVEYDKNGNITKLKRQGHRNTAATSFGIMDDLTYTYDSGNKLMKVADAATIDQFGFKDDAINTATDTSDDYSYDTNGNLKTDTNKGITSILYNYLNLPTEIKFDNSNTKKINYTYSAEGIKLKKVVNDGGVLTTTDYSNSYTYENNTLQFFNHPEGYVHNDNGTFKYVYNYLDHLGSIRLSYSDGDSNGTISQSEIIKENHYYPYGLKLRGFNSNVSSLGNSVAKKYMFNGKEFDDSFNETLNTYDFGARNYDSALGKWMNLDPLAEQMRRHSPYNYAFDNPLRFVDPDGMSPEDIIIWYKDDNDKDQYFRFDGGNDGLSPDNEFVNQVIKAYCYNVSNSGGDAMKDAAEDKNTDYHVFETNLGSSSSSTSENIWWNPNGGLQVKETGDVLSPATVFEHEFDHATDRANNPEAHSDRKRKPDKNYTNKEEGRVITGNETKTARANGEISINAKVSRKSHGGNTKVHVEGPTSTKVNKKKSIELRRRYKNWLYQSWQSD